MIASGADYETARDRAGMVERAGHAVLELEGADAAEFLQGQITNDVEALEPGSGCYAALLDHKGKIRTDLRVLRIAPERLLVLAEPAGRPILRHVFDVYSLGRQVSHRDASDERAVLSVIGPKARDLVPDAPPAAEHSWADGPYGIAVATDLGVDLIATAEQAAAARDSLGIPLVSEEAAECMRIVAGRPRLGHELDGVIPQEANINDRAVNFEKGCYVGQETVARLFYKGKPNRHLRGLRLSGPAQQGDSIRFGDREVGAVGSVCSTPEHGSIALSIIRREASPGDHVEVGGARTEAEVVDLPFADEP